MLDFQYADQQIAQNSPLVKEMTNLVELVIDKKKFIFDESEIGFEIKLLIEKTTLSIDSGKVKIQEDYLLYYISYLEFSRRLSFSSCSSLEKLLAFLEKIKENIRPTHIQGYLDFLRGVNSIALYHQYCEFKIDLLAFVNTLDKEVNNDLDVFTNAFNRMLPYQKLSEKFLSEILRKLYTLHEFDKLGVMNFNIVELDAGVKAFTTDNVERAHRLLDILLADFDRVNESIAIPVIAGLRKVDNLIGPRLAEMAKNELYQPLIVVSLSQNSTSIEDLRGNLQIVEGIKNDSKRYQLQLAAFYARIINNGLVTDDEMIVKCFSALQQLIIKNDVDFPAIVLRSLGSRKNYEKEKIDLLMRLIGQDQFDIQLTPFICQIFADFSDYKSYLKFLSAFAIKTGFNLDERIFEHCALRFRNKHPEEFDLGVIDFLIHDKGEIRWMGQRLLKTFNDHGIRLFAFEVLKLAPKSQFKLFTSIFSMLGEPKDLLPPLLPLMQASNQFVKESFICKIEILGEDYGSQVTKVLESEWQNRTAEQEEILGRIQSYIKEYSAEMNERNMIRELNPVYTQSFYLNSYLNGYQKVFQRDINENVEKNSVFHQLASTTILARGGGWKHQETGEITQLSKFASSFILPASYFISPDNFEWDKHKERNEKWDKFLNEWEAIL